MARKKNQAKKKQQQASAPVSRKSPVALGSAAAVVAAPLAVAGVMVIDSEPAVASEALAFDRDHPVPAAIAPRAVEAPSPRPCAEARLLVPHLVPHEDEEGGPFSALELEFFSRADELEADFAN